MTRKNVVLIYSDSVTSFSLFRDALRDHAGVFSAIIEVDSVPRRQDSFLPKKYITRKVFRMPLSFGLLNFLFINVYQVVAFISGSNLQNLAKNLGIPYFRFKRLGNPEIGIISKMKPDFIFNNSSLILGSDIIEIARIGVLNYHGAPLPMYRGAANYFWVLWANERCVHGTQHFVDDGLDTGPIIACSEPLEISGPTSSDMLRLEIIRRGRPLVDAALHAIRSDRLIKSTPQSNMATSRSFPTRSDAKQLRRNGHSVLSLRGILQVLRMAATGRD